MLCCCMVASTACTAPLRWQHCILKIGPILYRALVTASSVISLCRPNRTFCNMPNNIIAFCWTFERFSLAPFIWTATKSYYNSSETHQLTAWWLRFLPRNAVKCGISYRKCPSVCLAQVIPKRFRYWNIGRTSQNTTEVCFYSFLRPNFPIPNMR